MKTEKNKTALIKKGFEIKKDEKTDNYARLLKRRRIELNRTLEDVASGVCSTSYLSRIENAQVEVKDDFLRNLFEKLEISYERVKSHNNSEILKQLVNWYLKDDYEKMNRIVNDAIISEVYSEIELKLMMLFLNIVELRYEEARLTIKELEKVIVTFSEQEIVVFTYLSTLYEYKTNNILQSNIYMRKLLSLEYSDELFKLAINDLGVSIFTMTDDDINALECYYAIDNNKLSKLSRQRILCHYIEKLSIIGKSNYEYSNNAYNELADTITNESEEIINQFNYFFIKTKLVHKKCEECFEIFTKISKNANIMSLLNYCINISNDIVTSVTFLDELKNFQYNKYESFNMFYNEYTIKRIEKYNNLEIVDFIKRNLINVCIELKHHFILKNINHNYIEALFEIGKYKEATKFSLKMFETKN